MGQRNGLKQVRTACDRCYELKERCQRPSPSSDADCARCQRLGITCATIRSVKPAGRRARQRPPPKSTDAASIPLPANADTEERQLLLHLLSHPNSFNDYVVCPVFATKQHETILEFLPHAWPFLKDALLAWAITLKHLKGNIASTHLMGNSLPYLTKALSVFRSLEGSPGPTARIRNILGGLLAFCIYSTVGVGVSDVSRHCLSAGDKSLDNGDSWQAFHVLMEIASCLVHRQSPCRTLMASTATMDPHLGLTLPLIPYFQRLCGISESIRHSDSSVGISQIHNELADIRDEVEAWIPALSTEGFSKLDSADAVTLMAQAKVYRIGALLLCHRLQHPFGQAQADAEADALSREALMELQWSSKATNKSPKYVALPFIIAAVEVRGNALRRTTLNQIDDCVDFWAPSLKAATKGFLERMWSERDSQNTTRWFDSIYKPCPIIEAIDQTIPSRYVLA